MPLYFFVLGKTLYNVMQILCIIIMPSGARRCIKIINS